jgi:hypothetical protein
MDRRIIEYLEMGTGRIMDPIKPMRFNTIKARVGNMAAHFDKVIKKNPGGFSVDKKFFLSYIGIEKMTGYARNLFKRYGYRLRVLSKKPYVLVSKNENNGNK